jgi:hypothetical protein
MTAKMSGGAHRKTFSYFSDASGNRSAVWINDETGQVIENSSLESRIHQEADCERHSITITTPQQPKLDQRRRPIDLVGRAQDQQTAVAGVRKNPTSMLPELRRPLLLGKRGDS